MSPTDCFHVCEQQLLICFDKAEGMWACDFTCEVFCVFPQQFHYRETLDVSCVSCSCHSTPVLNGQLRINCWGGNEFVALVSPPPVWQNQCEKTYTVSKSTNSGFSRLQLSPIIPLLTARITTHSHPLVTTKQRWFFGESLPSELLVFTRVCLSVCELQ